MGEIANRSMSFLVDKYSKMTAPAMEDERLHSLQRLLLRVRVIVEEAEGRHIPNQAMLQLLNIMRKEMYRGYHTLDTFRYPGNEDEKAGDHKVRHSFTLSKSNPAKRLFLSSTGDTESEKELQQVLDNLNNIIADASELAAFLKSYPPLHRQPYSMHLLLDKCMFGRQMEMERIVDFLMQTEPHIIGTVGVLPIVGPAAVGKSTLVSHVCNNERVRNLFSRIVWFSEDDLNDQSVDNFKDGRVIKHQNNACTENEPLLIIVELPMGIDEDGRVIKHQNNACTEEDPKITFQDVLLGSVKYRGRIEVLAWRSQIPPYKNRIFSCEIQKPRRMAVKRSLKRQFNKFILPLIFLSSDFP